MAIKSTDQLKHRLKQAAVEEHLTYAQLLWQFLEQRDARKKRAQARARQVHPFHRPELTDAMEA